jgi:hypothetical protein
MKDRARSYASTIDHDPATRDVWAYVFTVDAHQRWTWGNALLIDDGYVVGIRSNVFDSLEAAQADAARFRNDTANSSVRGVRSELELIA